MSYDTEIDRRRYKMRLSLVASHRLEVRVQQLLKQELRQELRLVLEQLLKILQRLVQHWEVSTVEIQKLDQTMRELTYHDREDVVHEFVRRSKVAEVETLQAILRFMTTDTFGLSGIKDFSSSVVDKQIHVHQRSQKRGLILGLRLVLKRPDFLGGKEGTPDNLAKLLKAMPQWNGSCYKQDWLLAGGWAVELLTEQHLREHHDIDVVICGTKPLYLDCDEVHADNYFGVISTTTRFIREHCVRWVSWEHENTCYEVAVLCPEFLFLSKILRPPRSQDQDDVKLLVQQFGWKFNLELIVKLIRKNNCGFNRTRELMKILRTHDPNHINREIERFF